MARQQPASLEDMQEALRAEAIADLEMLRDAVAQARRDIGSYQSAIEKNYRHLSKGGRATDMRECSMSPPSDRRSPIG